MDANIITQQPVSAPVALPKEAIRYITQNITPEEVQYVSDVKCAYDDYKCKYNDYKCKCDKCEDGECECCKEEDECCEAAMYVTQIMSFCDKFRVMHWAAPNMSYHKALDDFCEELDEYKDAIAENLQSIVGQFTGGEFHTIELPVSDNPLDIINELKICAMNFLNCIKDDPEYEGCANATSDFLETVHRYIYIFRICKD